MSSALIVLGLIVFLYFGYKDDFKRNKSEFIYTIAGVLIFMISFYVIETYDSVIGLIIGILLVVISLLIKSKIKGMNSQG